MTRGSPLLLLCALAACSNAGGFDAHLRRGAEALQAGEPKVARIELLNAIKARPDDKAARLLQAKVHLALGDGAAAQAELRRARDIGVAPAATRTMMAEALLLQGRDRDALAEAQAAPQQHAADAARFAGRALAALGDQDRAAAAFDRAVALNPDSAPLWVDVARFRRSAGDIAGAIAASDRAVRIDPKDADALVVRGELTRAQYGLKAALPWFDRAIAEDPDHVTAWLEKAATLGELGRARGMLAASRKALSLQPGHPVAYYLQAVLAARTGRYPLARALLAKTGGALDTQPATMLFAAALDSQAGNHERAVKRLADLVALQPDNAKARRLLAAAQLGAGDASDALATIRPLADRDDADIYALRLAAEAAGDTEAANAYRSRAAGGAGRFALAAFEGPAQRVRALAADGDVAGAVAEADRMRTANPGAPGAHMLAGDARILAGDAAGAAAAYRAAANLSFTEPVALRLVEALEAAGETAAAARVLGLFLDQNPRSIGALRIAGERYLAAEDWAAAQRVFAALRRRLGGRDAAVDTSLAWAMARQGDYTAALPIARQAWALDPANPGAADSYGWMLFRSGRKAEGLALLLASIR